MYGFSKLIIISLLPSSNLTQQNQKQTLEMFCKKDVLKRKNFIGRISVLEFLL